MSMRKIWRRQPKIKYSFPEYTDYFICRWCGMRSERPDSLSRNKDSGLCSDCYERQEDMEFLVE